MKIICEVTRGKHVESRHEVYAVAIDESEKIIFTSGDPKYVTCIRSALKPFQASASIKSGAVTEAKFTDEDQKYGEVCKKCTNDTCLLFEEKKCQNEGQ